MNLAPIIRSTDWAHVASWLGVEGFFCSAPDVAPASAKANAGINSSYQARSLQTPPRAATAVVQLLRLLCGDPWGRAHADDILSPSSMQRRNRFVCSSLFLLHLNSLISPKITLKASESTLAACHGQHQAPPASALLLALTEGFFFACMQNQMPEKHKWVNFGWKGGGKGPRFPWATIDLLWWEF